jgi:hypothetical protein
MVKLALACCAVSAARVVTGQETVPWNLVGGFDTEVLTRHSGGTVFLYADGYSSEVPAGATEFTIEGDSCWAYQYCYSSNCAPTAWGDLKFEISSQAIIVSLVGDLPSPFPGTVRFGLQLSEPTTAVWPGGSAFLEPNTPYGVDLLVPVTVSPAGFPIVFSAPVSPQSISTLMLVDTPNVTRSCAENAWDGCAIFLYGYCQDAWIFHGGTLSTDCAIDGYQGFNCMCGYYLDVGARAVAHSTATLTANRFDLEARTDWGCSDRLEGYWGTPSNSGGRWYLGLDRPIRLSWDYVSCGPHSTFIGPCGGAGTLELDPRDMPYGYFGYYYFDLASFHFELGSDSDKEYEGSDRFIIQNLRFERIYPADVIPDGLVDGSDLSAILSKWGGPYDPQRTAADVNLDGKVDAEDLAAVLFAWGTPG